MRRNRVNYAVYVAIVMLSGLASRKFSFAMPDLISAFAGDILWALMVFLGLGFIFTKWTTYRTGTVAMLFSFLIEFSQLYHAPWIDAVRRTTLGGLVLGFGFLASDLICYSVGIGIGIIIELVTSKKTK